MNPVRRTRRSGFTFAELLASMTVMSILTLGMASAIHIAGKALPEVERASTKLIRETQFADEFSMDLEVAVHITERTAQSIAFTVADRDGDGSPERFRYAWSGTPGAPLTRQYNGGSVTNVLEDVHSFGLAYDIQAVTEEYPGPQIESAEFILSQYTAAGDSDYIISAGNWVGQYFDVDGILPPEAVSWSVTRVGFVARSVDEIDGESSVELRPATGDNKPGVAVLKKRKMRENVELSDAYQWVEFAMNGDSTSDLSPGRGLCLVIKLKQLPDAASIHFAQNSGSGRVETSDGGNSWSYINNDCMRYKIWGTYNTLGPPQTATRQYVTRVRMALQVGDDSSSRIDTSVRTLNTPEVLSAVWELNFDTDPTTLDMNGDGLGDWGDAYQQSFDPATLVNGIWYAPQRSWGIIPLLNTAPDFDFTELTTVDLRYRATSTGGEGTELYIYTNQQAGSFAAIYLTLWKPKDDTHELWVQAVKQGGGTNNLVKYTVPDDFVNVRAVIDPAVDTIAVWVNGAHIGTFTYFSGATQSTYYNWSGYSESAAYIYAAGCSAEWDHVSIRVGGNN